MLPEAREVIRINIVSAADSTASEIEHRCLAIVIAIAWHQWENKALKTAMEQTAIPSCSSVLKYQYADILIETKAMTMDDWKRVRNQLDFLPGKKIVHKGSVAKAPHCVRYKKFNLVPSIILELLNNTVNNSYPLNMTKTVSKSMLGNARILEARETSHSECFILQHQTSNHAVDQTTNTPESNHERIAGMQK